MNLDSTVDARNIRKALRYYQMLKKNKDVESKGISYANKSLDYIKKVKNKSKFQKILNETEDYCNNFLKNSVNFDDKEKTFIKYEDIFKLIEEGDLEKLKKIEINPKDITRLNDEGLSPLHYCIKTGDTTILKKLLSYDVSINSINKKGNTLIEFACLNNDPNMINFLTNHGAFIKKNLFLREKKVKIKLKTDNLDVACICKMMIMNSYQKKMNEKIKFLCKFINFNKLCGYGNFTVENLLIGISESLDEESLDNYLEIVKEELSYKLDDAIYCYKNKIEILIYNLLPFIEYNFNVSQENAILMELYFLKKKYNNKELIDILFENYIEKILPEDFIGVQIKKIINKF